MIKETINKIIQKMDLSFEEMVGVMNEIMTGGASPAQIGSFITALRMKGETVEEISGAAQVMREKALSIKTSADPVVDTCGTGGDGAATFNISTTAAFVAAGAGITVAKHGNRSVSSKCGSADLLKALGVNIEVRVEVVEECLNNLGIGFLFAPLLHGAMKYALGPRREIGIRTIFNILGPLTNPAGAKAQVLGVYDRALTEPLAEVLKKLGSEYVFVVHGMDGLDEISIGRETKISELKNGVISTYKIRPEDFDLQPAPRESLRGGNPAENARITLDILAGKDKGSKRDIVLLNTAAAIMAGGKAESFKAGIELARDSLENGRAREKLIRLRELTNSRVE